jgi:hypothetical protein
MPYATSLALLEAAVAGSGAGSGAGSARADKMAVVAHMEKVRLARGLQGAGSEGAAGGLSASALECARGWVLAEGARVSVRAPLLLDALAAEAAGRGGSGSARVKLGYAEAYGNEAGARLWAAGG